MLFQITDAKTAVGTGGGQPSVNGSLTQCCCDCQVPQKQVQMKQRQDLSQLGIKSPIPGVQETPPDPQMLKHDAVAQGSINHYHKEVWEKADPVKRILRCRN